MSGGHYDYAYRKVDALDSLIPVLKDMADRCRQWSSSDRADTKYVDGKKEPSALEDRAHILLRALLLERAAEHLQKVCAELHSIEEIMHDVEWVASGDYGMDALMDPIEEGK